MGFLISALLGDRPFNWDLLQQIFTQVPPLLAPRAVEGYYRETHVTIYDRVAGGKEFESALMVISRRHMWDVFEMQNITIL